MPAQWTGELIGQMHLKKVTKKELARAISPTLIRAWPKAVSRSSTTSTPCT